VIYGSGLGSSVPGTPAPVPVLYRSQLLAFGEAQRFQLGSRTIAAIWIIALAMLAALIAAGFYSLAL
jgi:hypothetical protein